MVLSRLEPEVKLGSRLPHSYHVGTPSYAIGSREKPGAIKHERVILAGQAEVPSSSPAWLANKGEFGHLEERVSIG
jgi:hypothetical protein